MSTNQNIEISGGNRGNANEDQVQEPPSIGNPVKRRRIAALSDDEDELNDMRSYNNGDDDSEPYDENSNMDEEEEEGEDLLENAMRDYSRIEALDTYGTEGLDDRMFASMTREERLGAEAELEARDGRRAGREIVKDGWVEVEEDEEDRLERRRRFRFDRDKRGDLQEGEYDDDEEDEALEQVNLEAFDVELREWIAQDRTRREIMRRFRNFLNGFDDHYKRSIRVMASRNTTSLEISFLHLSEKEPILAVWLEQAPKDMIEILDETATRFTLALFPRYRMVTDDTIHVRIAHLPVMDSIRDLRNIHLQALIKVNGVITKRTAVYPQIKVAYYDCMRCSHILGPFHVEHSDAGFKPNLPKPGSCPSCQASGENTFKINPTRTIYRNYQRATLQESPGTVPPGRVPRSKEILFCDDLIDAARPGAQVTITGIYQHSYDGHLTQRSGFPVFHTHIVSNHISLQDSSSSEFEESTLLSEADKKAILELSRDPKIAQKIINSIAPSIKGHAHAKMALAMALFSGVPKNIHQKHRIRGDVNVLLIGDPGTAKSQMLKYAEKTAPRAVYSAGKGASAVGLTASVHKDALTKQWTLEGGALVLADRGVCLIDEFDKMNEQDRTSIHEAMEQQSISISKAGIVTSLMARCAVIAAANPIGGRYDSSCTLAENVELTDPILQRFDCLCVMQDVVDPVEDERLALFVTGSHMRSRPTSDLRNKALLPNSISEWEKDRIPQALLKKYIQYARSTCRPILRGNIDQEKIASLYSALRRESCNSGGVPIAVRHIESMMRMSEAHAKMHLREHVREDDVDASIQMMLTSFISAQKFSVRRNLERGFAKYLRSNKDKSHLLLHILQEMIRNEAMYQTIRSRQKGQDQSNNLILEVSMVDFQSRARERKVYDVDEFCRSDQFKDAGFQMDHGRGMIIRSGNI